MSSDLLTLSFADLQLELSPSIGGAISRLSYLAGSEPRSILRDCHTPLENVLEAASFPLVPFVNRVRGGSFQLSGPNGFARAQHGGRPKPAARTGVAQRLDCRQFDRVRSNFVLSSRSRANGRGRTRPSSSSASTTACSGSAWPAATHRVSRCPAASASTPISRAPGERGLRPGSVMSGRSTRMSCRSTRSRPSVATTSATG